MVAAGTALRRLMDLPLTPLDFLLRARRLFTKRVGIVDADLRLTYGEFAHRCDRLASALRRELGIRTGDRVAWLCGNTHELLEAYYGVLLAGGVLLPLNIRLSPAELRFILDDSGASVLFRHPDAAGRRSSRAHGAARRGLRGVARPPAGGAVRPPRGRRARSGRALLHERQHRRAQGRGALTPGAVPPRGAQRAHDGAHRQRRGAAHDPALPRERVGHAALRHRARRRPRDAAALRRGRGAPAGRGRGRHPPVPGAHDDAVAPGLAGAGGSRHEQPRAGVHRRGAGGAGAAGRGRGEARLRVHLRLRHDRVEPNAHPLPGQAGRAEVRRPPGDHRAADRRRRPARARRRTGPRCPGTAPASARSAPARTTS